ncbi:hypothetical protein [Streptomyces sp. NPDC005805]|uniref:hypothetical protein n=1 Tax=Streptomyces sp. NPDC005805 TaxID=3157068 RepID=UPI0033DEBC2C
MRRTVRRLTSLAAVGLLTALGAAAPAQAADPEAYLVAVEWVRYKPADAGDCATLVDFCNQSEAFGTMATHTTATGARASGTRLNWGKWEPQANCYSWDGEHWEYPRYSNETAGYNDAKDCLKRLDDDVWYGFDKVMMCKSASYLRCDNPKAKNNNVVLLKVYPGDRVRLSAHFRDWDYTSASDDTCNVTEFTEPLTHATLRNLDRGGRMVDQQPDGGCILDYRLRTFAPVN